MSHHLDSELARQDPRLDISDMYVFRGSDGTALVMNVNPRSGARGFHDEARYNFKIDTDGDDLPDLTLRSTFGSYEEGEPQNVSLEIITHDHKQSNTQEILTGKTDEIIVTENRMKRLNYFAGRAAEPFFIAGPVVSAARESINSGQPLALGDFDPDNAENLFANTNVQSIVIEIPDSILAVRSIGVWGTVDLATDAGGWRQVQRAAKPLINTLYDFTAEDPNADYNASQPHQDKRLYAQTVRKLTARAVEVNGTSTNPHRHAKQVAKLIFPDVLEYDIETEASFRHNNGRNLVDPDAENMINFVLNTRIPMGLDSSDATGQLRSEFPYVSRPI